MNVLLAGATGLVGFEVLKLLKAQGHRVQTVSRDPARAERLRAFAEKVHLVDATLPGALNGVCEGVEVVISALGAPVSMQSNERRSFANVDTVANVALVAEARRAGVKRFVYVGVYTEAAYAESAYVRSHTAVETALNGSGLEHVVVKPSGVFGALGEFVTMARKGPVPVIGSGASTTNPVHEADVAEVVVRAAEGGVPSGSTVDVGGPEVLSRRDIALLAFRAVDAKPRVMAMPKWVMSTVATVYGAFNPRMGEFMKFVIAVSTSSCVAPKVGQKTLGAYFDALAKR